MLRGWPAHFMRPAPGGRPTRPAQHGGDRFIRAASCLPGVAAGRRRSGTCQTAAMQRHLPAEVMTRTPSEKLVWLYIDRDPGEHSARSLYRAPPGLVRGGLVIEEIAPAGARPGKHHTATAETRGGADIGGAGLQAPMG
jgi:hypothetical protein